MENTVLLVSHKLTNLTYSFLYKLNETKINTYLYTKENITLKYDSIEIVTKLPNVDNITTIIFIDYSDFEELSSYNIPVIFIGNNIKPLKRKCNVSYIKTNLIEDASEYTDAQREFLFKKGIYSILNNEMYKLLKLGEDTPNGIIIDLTNVSNEHNNWIFDFDSISESYNWLTKMIRKQEHKNTIKSLEFYKEDGIQYADTDKEIKYLTERINAVRDGKKIKEVFISDKKGFARLKNNHFFNVLIKEISENYNMYFLNIDKLAQYSKNIYEEIEFGILIFEDCIYRDYANTETSLGYVDCNSETRDKYIDYFDIIINELATKIESGDDINEF